MHVASLNLQQMSLPRSDVLMIYSCETAASEGAAWTAIITQTHSRLKKQYHGVRIVLFEKLGVGLVSAAIPNFVSAFMAWCRHLVVSPYPSLEVANLSLTIGSPGYSSVFNPSVKYSGQFFVPQTQMNL